MDTNFVIKCILVGLITGIIFTYLKLDIPAPNNIPAIAGIIGLYLGMIITQNLRK